LKKGNRQGLFLPQVAREHPYWSKEEFLEELSIKAGLPPSAYKEADAEFFIFTVENFSE
jgi:AMMECR1 domain-containing protein